MSKKESVEQFAFTLARAVKAKVVRKSDRERDAALDARDLYLRSLEEQGQVLSATQLAELSDKFQVANTSLNDKQYQQAADRYRALKNDLETRYWKAVDAVGEWEKSSRKSIANIKNALEQAKAGYLAQVAEGSDPKDFEARWVKEVQTPVLNRIDQYTWLGEDHGDRDGALRGLRETETSYLPGCVGVLGARVVGEKDAGRKLKLFHDEQARVADELEKLKHQLLQHVTGSIGDSNSKDQPSCKSLEYFDRQLADANDRLYASKGRPLVGPALDRSLAESRACLAKLSAEIGELGARLDDFQRNGDSKESLPAVWQEQAARDFAKSWTDWTASRERARSGLDELAYDGGTTYREKRATFDHACQLAEEAERSFANLRKRFPIAPVAMNEARKTLADILDSLNQSNLAIDGNYLRGIEDAINERDANQQRDLKDAAKQLVHWKDKLNKDNLLDVPSESTYDRWPAAPAPIQAILTDRMTRANSAWAARNSPSPGAVRSAAEQLSNIHRELTALAREYDQTFGKSGSKLIAQFKSVDDAVDKVVASASQRCPTLARELRETYQREFQVNPANLTIDQALDRAATFVDRYVRPAREEVDRAAKMHADERQRIESLEKKMAQLHRELQLPGEMCGAYGARLKGLLAELNRADGPQQIMKVSLAVAQLEQQFRAAAKDPDFQTRIAADAARSQQAAARLAEARQEFAERYRKFVDGPYRQALNQPNASQRDIDSLQRLASVVQKLQREEGGLPEAELQFSQMRQLAAEMVNRPARRSIRDPRKLHASWTAAMRQYATECEQIRAAVANRVKGHFQQKGTPGDGQSTLARLDDLFNRVGARLKEDSPACTQLHTALNTLADGEIAQDEAKRARELALRAIHSYRDWIENDPVLQLLTSKKNPFDPRLSVAALRKTLDHIEVQVLLSVS